MFFLNPTEKKALNEFSSLIKNALNKNLFDLKLFGSKSTGKFHDESDIDVLIVVKHRDEEVMNSISDILLDIELKYAAKVSPIVLTTAEFLKNQQHQTLFYHEVSRDGVTL
ncbi:Nucleotidyltransferase domain-containing protein [Desulfotomaculum arcticum]|uniref:Nucleotidyltransferase domain-containing protein n=1 Tax=Desulfotruncus arcticus DSM 17038 TaxID=1121424 RepID=A0A1I2TE21_9FIRM|nr:nucleotidyltransferase domain-containing protein [Desulfotruncus arcticus]SFG61597.1 Nucleotidyltransferase domain-containing protein [Desulfotomaculum arcticum] [Desulfotruncus arcticus DSM 17038]